MSDEWKKICHGYIYITGFKMRYPLGVMGDVESLENELRRGSDVREGEVETLSYGERVGVGILLKLVGDGLGSGVCFCVL